MSTDKAVLLNETENQRAAVFVWAHYARGCKAPWWRYKATKNAAAHLYVEATGLGFGVRVQCSRCGQSVSITDSSNW